MIETETETPDDVPAYLRARYAEYGPDSSSYTYEEWCQIYPLTMSASILRAKALPTSDDAPRDVFAAKQAAAEQESFRGRRGAM